MTDYAELKRLARRVIDLEASGDAPIGEAWDEFEAAATPSVVLPLIAENERLKREAKNDLIAYKAVLERQQEIREECDDQAAKFKEWQASHHANYCMVARARDQLKAENEALRKALGDCTESLEGEVLQKYHGQPPDDMHPVTRRDYDRDMAEINGYKALSKETP